LDKTINVSHETDTKLQSAFFVTVAQTAGYGVHAFDGRMTRKRHSCLQRVGYSIRSTYFTLSLPYCHQ
jgi:hypothetical protein